MWLSMLVEKTWILSHTQHQSKFLAHRKIMKDGKVYWGQKSLVIDLFKDNRSEGERWGW